MAQTLTAKHRPATFDEMVGQKDVIAVLKAIAKSPADVTRSIILSGPFGSGKTSVARIFARSLNCEVKKGDCCNKCSNCLSIRDGSSLYAELDAAVIGNKEAILSLREQFAYSIKNGYRVLVLDEAQLASRAAQGALLKVLEEAPSGIFFVFATTDPQDLLPTIHSRSLVLELQGIEDSEMGKLLDRVSSIENISLSEKNKEYIIRRVKGHARDAVQQLELLRLLGEEEFSSGAFTLDSMFKMLLNALNKGEKVQDLVVEILQHPLSVVEQDFEVFIREVADRVFSGENQAPRVLRELVLYYIKNHKYLENSNDWYLFLTSLSSIFEQKQQTQANKFSKV